MKEEFAEGLKNFLDLLYLLEVILELSLSQGFS